MPEMTAGQRGSGAHGLSALPGPQRHTRWHLPCEHIAGAETCGATPTRHYGVGRRCEDHTPARIAGRPETRPDPDRTANALRARDWHHINDRRPSYGNARTDPPRYDTQGNLHRP
jgi:hypothetical protein